MEKDRIFFTYAWTRERKEVKIELPVGTLEELSAILANEFKNDISFPIVLKKKYQGSLSDIQFSELEDLMEVEFDMVIEDIVYLRNSGTGKFLRCSLAQLSRLNRVEFCTLCGCDSPNNFFLCNKDELAVENVVDFPGDLVADKTYFHFSEAKRSEKTISFGKVLFKLDISPCRYASVDDFCGCISQFLNLPSSSSSSLLSGLTTITKMDQLRFSTELSFIPSRPVRLQPMVFLYDESPKICLSWVDLNDNDDAILASITAQGKFDGGNIGSLITVQYHGNLSSCCEKLKTSKRSDFNSSATIVADKPSLVNVMFVPFIGADMSQLRDYDLLCFGSLNSSMSSPLSASIIKWMALLGNPETKIELSVSQDINSLDMVEDVDDPITFSSLTGGFNKITITSVSRGHMRVQRLMSASIVGRLADAAVARAAVVSPKAIRIDKTPDDWKQKLLAMGFDEIVVTNAVASADTFEAALNICFESGEGSSDKINSRDGMVESKEPARQIPAAVHAEPTEDQMKTVRKLDRDETELRELLLHVRVSKPCRMYGTRFRRGRDWRIEYGDQDGGAGSLGTVVPHLDRVSGRVDEKEGVVAIMWDFSHTVNVYACGLAGHLEVEAVSEVDVSRWVDAHPDKALSIGMEVVRVTDAHRTRDFPIGTVFYISKSKCHFLVSWRNVPSDNKESRLTFESYYDHLLRDALPSDCAKRSSISIYTRRSIH